MKADIKGMLTKSSNKSPIDTSLVVKSNKLIEARFSLGVIEQKVVLAFIAMINSNDANFQEYEMDVRSLCNIMGVKGENYYPIIKEMTKAIRDKGFTIKEDDGDLQIGWFSSIKYHDKKGKVSVSFDPKLKPYLLDLKKDYTKYRLYNAIVLKGSYSIRFYELLKQYEFLGARSIEVEKLKEILRIPTNKYAKYNSFKFKVINKAIAEINKKTDIMITYKEIRSERKVHNLEFTIDSNKEFYEKRKYEMFISVPDEIIEIIPEQYRESVISLVVQYIDKNGPAYVQRAIEYTNRVDYHDYRKYLYTVLSKNLAKDWDPKQLNLFSKQGLRDHKLRLKREAEEIARQKAQEEVKLRNEFSAKATKIANERIDILSEEERMELRETVLKNNPELKKEKDIQQFMYLHLKDEIERELIEQVMTNPENDESISNGLPPLP
ncbi:MAG: replication initiation protein [Desulfomonilia bacterium]|jgi:plasmid replication initiation protein